MKMGYKPWKLTPSPIYQHSLDGHLSSTSLLHPWGRYLVPCCVQCEVHMGLSCQQVDMTPWKLGHHQSRLT